MSAVDATADFGVLDTIVAQRRRAGVFTDFDGTLSEIVERPEEARPIPGATDVLESLAHEYAWVGVLSGRPVAFLQPLLPPSVFVAGLYGLETILAGERHDHEYGGSWREVVDDVAAQSEARGPVRMRVERKGLSLTLHYRGDPDIEPEVRAWAEKQAARSGLVPHAARMSYELHPPIAVDKGTTLLDLCEGLDAVCFLGDDLGDLAAFDALDTLAERGVDTVRVAVRSSEQPDELARRADLLVNGPTGALAALTYLRDAAHA